MKEARFSDELSSYELILSQWARFVVQQCVRFPEPNRVARDVDGNFWLLHDVGDLGEPIFTREGMAVRIVKLRIGEEVARTFH